MKKNEIVKQIVANYDLQLTLTEDEHSLAQEVLVKTEDGKKIKTTGPQLQTLLNAINAGGADEEKAEEKAEQTPEEKQAAINKLNENLDDWSDEEMDAETDKANAAKLKAKQAKAKEAAARVAAVTEKKNGATSRSVLSGPGAVIVGKGLAIFTTWKEDRYDATLLPDGKVVMGGTTYSSPFNAYNKGIGAYRNGWKFWLFVDADGKDVRINELREGKKDFTAAGGSRSGTAGIENRIEKRAKKIERLTRELADAKESLKVLKVSLKDAQKEEKAKEAAKVVADKAKEKAAKEKAKEAAKVAKAKKSA